MKVSSTFVRNPNSAKVFGYLSILLFLLACATPAINYVYEDGGGAGSRSGWELLIQGWAATGFPQMGWCANPVLFVAFYFLLRGKWRNTFVLGLLAFGLGLTTFSLHRMDVRSLAGSIYISEIRLVIGAYLWLASMVVLVLGAALGYRLHRFQSARG